MQFPPLPLLLLLPLLTSSLPPSLHPRRIDSIIHSSALHSLPKHHKTAVPYNISIPPSLSSSATAQAMRFRAGRLHRQGVVFTPFLIPPGIAALPHSKRLLIVLQNLGNLSSSLYSLPGHNLISPVFGLLFYDASGTKNSKELDVNVSKKSIEVNFLGIEGIKEGFLCVVFGLGKKVEVLGGGGRVCFVKGQGHFALVVKKEEGRRWKVVVAGVVVGMAGVGLVGLVAVAVVKGRRREWRMAEMERRGREDETLRMSIVGGSRAYMAAAVRTPPTMESEDGLPM